jgi:peptide/nickel transport system substrate-binding protein
MRSSLRARTARAFGAAALAATLLLPAAAHVTAADPLVLKVGTLQDMTSLNPWNANLVIDYEAFQLNYDLLVGFGNDLKPVPGFAESWSPSADGLTWTFKIRPGMKWSDGQPATSEDARFTIQMALDAQKSGITMGLGYTQAYITDAGITAVAAPDPETLVVTTKYPTQRVLSMDAPILPKHVWEKVKPKDAGDFKMTFPVVGTGPYQAVEWKAGQFARFERNPNYWGTQGAADQIIYRFFPDSQDTMVAAFKSNELDYIRNPSAQQFDQLKTLPGVVAIDAPATGFDELGFNTYDKDIPGGGASTKALRDPAFRDALGYAIDKQAILDKVYHGHGTVGTTVVPPYYVDYHVEPTTPRTFDIALAKQKLDAAGYVLDASGARLDKEGKPLNLRLYFPNSDTDYPPIAQFITDWFGQLGIKVKSQAFDDDTLSGIEVAPTADPPGKADYDMFIWGWLGDNGDPNTLLNIFLTSSIASQGSDSLYSNPKYDALYKEQNEAPSADARKAPMAEMQQLTYNEAPYHIIANGSELHVYRTDKFANWQQMPVGTGTPFFVMGTLNYTALTDAKAAPSVAPTAATSAGTSAAPAGSQASEASPGPAASAATKADDEE